MNFSGGVSSKHISKNAEVSLHTVLFWRKIGVLPNDSKKTPVAAVVDWFNKRASKENEIVERYRNCIELYKNELNNGSLEDDSFFAICGTQLASDLKVTICTVARWKSENAFPSYKHLPPRAKIPITDVICFLSKKLDIHNQKAQKAQSVADFYLQYLNVPNCSKAI